MTTAAELGITEAEFQDAVNLEKIYACVAKCREQCTRCSSKPIIYCKTDTVDLLCEACGNGKPHCKRVADAHLRSKEVEKFEKKFGKGGSKNGSSSRAPAPVRPSTRDNKKKQRGRKSKPMPPSVSSQSSCSESESTASSGSFEAEERKRRARKKHHSKSVPPVKNPSKKPPRRRRSSSSLEESFQKETNGVSAWGTFEQFNPQSGGMGSENPQNVNSVAATAFSPMPGMVGLLQQQQHLFQQQHPPQQVPPSPPHSQSQVFPPQSFGGRSPQNNTMTSSQMWSPFGGSFGLNHLQPKLPQQPQLYPPAFSLDHQKAVSLQNPQQLYWSHTGLPPASHDTSRALTIPATCSNPFAAVRQQQHQFQPAPQSIKGPSSTNPFVRRQPPIPLSFGSRNNTFQSMPQFNGGFNQQSTSWNTNPMNLFWTQQAPLRQPLTSLAAYSSTSPP